MTGSLSTSDTNDYFKVTLPAGKTLSATLTPASGKDFDLQLQNSSGTQLKLSENGAGAADSFTYANTGSSSIVVYVRAYYYSGTSGTYTLNLSW
ncbi:pre-peptidase C-terminal domain-containing protein [Roseateles sp. UC29_93]|uniref:pre-peptidase C-terminal domain-containing protein n=1 Tax=Roseateles sp. UC29_93 TaxID=3350177 RepID=UPI0036705A27